MENLENYRSTLSKLRWMAAQIADSAYCGMRQAGSEMVAYIDAEMARKEPVHRVIAEPSAPDQIPTEALLREIGRRIRQVRHLRKLCRVCERRPVRANGMCMHCYQEDRKRSRQPSSVLKPSAQTRIERHT